MSDKSDSKNTLRNLRAVVQPEQPLELFDSTDRMQQSQIEVTESILSDTMIQRLFMEHDQGAGKPQSARKIGFK
jgi:hypothetical protein